jgi:hypothetical protein
VSAANEARGEAALRVNGIELAMRPSFAALTAAEEELGSLFAMVERAAAGKLRLSEMAALFWHCVRDRPEALDRTAFSEGVAAGGLVAAAPALKVLLRQILQGR